MRMKIWMVGGIAALSLIVGLAAQDGPNSQSSQTVAKPRKGPAPDTGNTPADDAERIRGLLRLTVQGIAAGMRTTG